MKYSIIVPIYNVETYIDKCIDSLISQSYLNIEIILVDDGSTDASGDICDRYADQDSRILVIHKENGGLVSARKAGINAATGDYALYVDGDDWISKNAISTVNDYITEYAPDCVCFGLILKKKNNEIRMQVDAEFGFYEKNYIQKNIYPYLIEDMNGKYFSHSAVGKAYRTDLLKKFQNDVDNRIAMSEDAALTLPLICSIDSMFIMSECLYYYNMLNLGSITRIRKVFDWDNPYYVMEFFLANRMLKSKDFKNQIYRNATHNLFNVAMSQFNSGLSYRENKKIINEKLSKEDYKTAIKKGRHSLFTINALADFILRHKLYWALYLCWKFKYR